MSNRFYSVSPVAVFAIVGLMMLAPGGNPGKPGGGNGNGGGDPAVEYFVDAVAGDDANAGSQEAPFATLERAQEAARLEPPTRRATLS